MGALAAVLLVAITLRSLWAAEAARAAWSATTVVIVATRDLPAGAVVGPADLREQTLPLAVVPSGAATGDTAAVIGRRVTRPVLAGEPVVDARLAPAGLGPTAALLAPGWRAVSIRLGVAPPPLLPGDRVELVAVASGVGTSGPASVIAPDAEVVASDLDALVVAVPAEVVPTIVGAMANGLVTAVLLGA